MCLLRHGELLGAAHPHRMHVRRDVLEEHDGPMLRHGLREMEGLPLQLPRSREQRPREEYLEERFARFRAA
jgi:putative restriction endonuclease